MGDSNKINYSLGGSSYTLQNLLTNSGLNVCPKADGIQTFNEVAKVQNPGFASSTGWLLDTNWSISGGVLNAVNVIPSQFAQQVITGLTPYGNYRFRINALTGADTWYTSTVSDGRVILAGNSTGVMQSGVFGVADSRGQITYRIHSPVASLNMTFDSIQLDRIDPSFTNGEAPQDWQRLGVNAPFLSVDGNLNKIQNNSISSLRIVSLATSNSSDGIYYDISSPSFRRVLTFGCYVLQDVASSIQVGFSNDTLTVHSSVSSVVTGSTNTNYVWLETTVDNSSGTYSKVGVRITVPNTTAYITQPMLVNGISIGEGNYNRPVREWVDLETGNLTNVRWSSALFFGNGRNEADASIPGVTTGKIPGNICAVDVVVAFDSATASIETAKVRSSSTTQTYVVSTGTHSGTITNQGTVVAISGGINVIKSLGTLSNLNVDFKRVCVTY